MNWQPLANVERGILAGILGLMLGALGTGGCSSPDRGPAPAGSKRSRGTLECRAPAGSGPILSLFSFLLGGPVTSPKQADLCFYFDANDCAGGALVGHRDEQGWLFPLGRRTWRDLSRGAGPPGDEGSTEGIRPVTKAQEGTAFRVKTTSGRQAVVRIGRVRPATYAELAQGGTARVEFEWRWW